MTEDHEVFLGTDPHDGIVVGEEWDQRLHERLRWADAVVCVVTSALATASEDTTARLWDVRDPHHPHPLGTLTSNNGGVSSVAFSPDGHTLATGSYDNTARLWDVQETRQPSTLTSNISGASSVTFSPDGHTLATASRDDTARLWDIGDLHHPSPLGALTGHESSVNGVTSA